MSLNKLRQQLDKINAEIVAAMNKRMQVAEEIAAYKKEQGLPFEDIEREKEVIELAKNKSEHPILKDKIGELFKLLMASAKDIEPWQRYQESPFLKIGIIGLGLMGGSIAKALKTKNSAITIATLHADNQDIVEAVKVGIIDVCYPTLEQLIKNCELIILSTPLSAIIPLAESIAKVGCHDLIVIDIGSVKSQIAEAFEKLSSESIEFVATHPMAGSEKQGFAHSQATLFLRAPWVITPHRHNKEQTLHKVEQLLLYLGSSPKRMNPRDHDEQAALISHLPGMISADYLRFVEEKRPESLSIAGPGFRSFTRLAHSNAQMRKEIAELNAEHINSLKSQFNARN